MFKVDNAGYGRHLASNPWVKYDDLCKLNSQYPGSMDDVLTSSSFPDSSLVLANALTSNNVYYRGQAAYFMSESPLSMPKLFAPSPYKDGSSISHLDGIVYPTGTRNSLMKSAQDPAEAVHSPGEIGLAMLEDLGWTTNRLLSFTQPVKNTVVERGDSLQLAWSDNRGGGLLTAELLRKTSFGDYTWYRSLQYWTSNYGISMRKIYIPSDVDTGWYKLKFLDGFQGYGMTIAFQVSGVPRAEMPLVTPGHGYYPGEQHLVMTQTQGADIHYNIDNPNDPTESDSLYSTPVPTGTNVTRTVRARAFLHNGQPPSLTRSETYYIGTLPPPVVTPEQGTYAYPLTLHIEWQAGTTCEYTFSPTSVGPPCDPMSCNGYVNQPTLTFPAPVQYRVYLRTTNGTEWSNLVDLLYTVAPSVRIAQVDPAGTSFGTWNKWESGGWQPYPDTNLIRPSVTEVDTFEASQVFKQGTTQKYNSWTTNDGPAVVVNHANVTITSGTSSALANFVPAKSATIQAQLLEGGNPGGTIDFKDPWLIDSSDSKGNLNRGLNAIWHRDIAAPFDPSLSSTYKGVFQDQAYNLPGHPYYSVGAPSSQTFTINGQQYTSSTFVRWDTVGANLQYPTSAQSAVVFNQSGAVVTARYKGNLISSSPAATSCNNQRKIATHNGATHAVYESGGAVWYVRYDGSTWGGEVLLSDPADTTAKNPSICVSLHPGNAPVINAVWEVGASAPHMVVFRRSTDDGLTWSSGSGMEDVGWGPSTGDAAPVAANLDDVVAVAWKSTSGLKVKFNPIENFFPGISASVPATDSTCGQPSLICIHAQFKLVYRRGDGHIMYREFERTGDYGVSFHPSLTDLSAAQTNASKPSITCTHNDQRVLVSWEADVSGGGHHVFVTEREANGNWREPVEFTRGTGLLRNSSVYINEADNQAYVTYECVVGGNVVNVASKHRALPSSTSPWRPMKDLGPGQCPANPAWAGTGDGVASSIWTTGTSSPFRISTYTLLPPYSIACTLLPSWNMTGIPVVVYDFAKTAVYPTATSYAFAMEGSGYVRHDTLANNRGWWIKFGDSTQTIVYEGDPIDSMAMVAINGWNIIGSISSIVPTSSVYSNPPGIIAPRYFRYQNGYVVTDTLKPGGGYWVKTTAQGSIILSSRSQMQTEVPPSVDSYDKFTITDAGGGKQDLYVRNASLAGTSDDVEMPPPPPEAQFDVRFSSGDFIKTVVPDSGATTLSIALEEAAYPVQLQWNIRPENGITYSILPDSGSGLGKTAVPDAIAGSHSVLIQNRAGGTVRLSASAIKKAPSDQLPTEYALLQNYPNPFNPSTRIHYELPRDGPVQIVVYDLLGREVATLVNEVKAAGRYDINFTTARISSGVYFYRMQAGSFVSVKKMLVLK